MVIFDHVYKTYPNGTNALHDVSFDIKDGEFVFLVGPSGSGKSTIIKLLTGEERDFLGDISVGNYDMQRIRRGRLPYMRRSIGVVFQDFRLIDTKTVYENVAFAMRVIGAKNGGEYGIRRRVPYMLQLVGLADKQRAYPTELSGGEQQRVAIARALVNDPALLIADEPTGNLDPARSLEIMTLLKKINELGTTMLVVTHERTLVDRFGGRVIAIENGGVVGDNFVNYAEAEKERIRQKQLAIAGVRQKTVRDIEYEERLRLAGSFKEYGPADDTEAEYEDEYDEYEPLEYIDDEEPRRAADDDEYDGDEEYEIYDDEDVYWEE
jgi:cell division transport system ATP-binding protein